MLPSMTAGLRKPMTLEAFLDWEDRQDLRWEFDGFQPVAMTGVAQAHAVIQANLITALTTRLRGSPCRAFGSDLKVLAAGSIRYPDAFVACGPIDPKTKMRGDPVVMFEIVSPSSARTDRITKNREYRDTPTVQRYVVLEQDFVGATVFTRDEAGWSGRPAAEDETLAMPEIGIEVPLSELYEGLTFEEQAEE